MYKGERKKYAWCVNNAGDQDIILYTNASGLYQMSINHRFGNHGGNVKESDSGLNILFN